jgi:hypothetical protein
MNAANRRARGIPKPKAPKTPQDAGYRTGQALQAVLAPTAFKPPAPLPQHPLQMEAPEVLKTV